MHKNIGVRDTAWTFSVFIYQLYTGLSDKIYTTYWTVYTHTYVHQVAVHTYRAYTHRVDTYRADTYRADTYVQGRYIQGRYIQGRYIQGRYIQGRYIQGRYIQGRYIQGRYIQGRYIQGRYIQTHTTKSIGIGPSHLIPSLIKYQVTSLHLRILSNIPSPPFSSLPHPKLPHPSLNGPPSLKQLFLRLQPHIGRPRRSNVELFSLIIVGHKLHRHVNQVISAHVTSLLVLLEKQQVV